MTAAERVKLTRLERETLEIAAKEGSAYAILRGKYGQAARQRKDCIARLMRSPSLIDPLIGPRFGTITQAGRAAIAGPR